MNEKLLIQACINSYGGEYGPVKKIFDRCQEFSVEHVEGLFGIKNGIAYVIFRGSDGFVDWKDNFKFFRTEIPYEGVNPKIKIHSGFLRQYKLIRKTIYELTDNYQNIVISGHSLGGALSVICAVDLQFNFPDKQISCVTFGSPRVGNKHFARSFNGRIPDALRFKYGNDTVTLVPPVLMGAVHVGRLVWLNEPATWKKILLFPVLWAGWPWDHYPQRYQKGLDGKRT